MNKVLLLCYYFPPMGMGGTQRSAKFVKYLPNFQWEPIVVTVKPVQYYAHDESLLHEVENRKIVRTESLDPLRLLARLKKKSSAGRQETDSKKSGKRTGLLNFLNRIIGGWLFIPDSKILWLPFAIGTSFRLIKKYRIPIFYTTSPPHSAHLGGLVLKLITGAKWVADFRDDWTGGESQPSPTRWHQFFNRLLEKFVLKSADHTIAMCHQLAHSLWKKSGRLSATNQFSIIMNGYDRDDFSGLAELPVNPQFTITHCGSISKVSDPEPFLTAIHELFRQDPDLKNQIQIQFIGTDIYGRLEHLVQSKGLEKFIRPIQYLPHREAIAALMQSHLLLLTIIKKSTEEIITGKIFEYLASGKPILLVSSEGEVARMVRSLQRGFVVSHSDGQGIQAAILDYFHKYKTGRLTFSEPLSVQQFDREKLTARLANIFNRLTHP